MSDKNNDKQDDDFPATVKLTEESIKSYNKKWEFMYKTAGNNKYELSTNVDLVDTFFDELIEELEQSEEMKKLNEKFKELHNEKYKKYGIGEFTVELTEEEKEELQNVR